VKANATPAQAHTAIASVWKMLQDLRQGIVRDLQPAREHILMSPRWLKTVSFGGPDDRRDIPDIELAQLMAGGGYAVPPKVAPPSFPGAEIFLEAP
jgi:hypothetical protein